MAVTFDNRPIYLGDRIILTGSYLSADTEAGRPVTDVPGIVIDAVIVMNTEAPTNKSMKTSGNINMPTQAVVSGDRRGFSLVGYGLDPGNTNGDGKILVYGRRA